MANPIGSLFRILLPAALVYVLYSWIGPVGGIITIAVLAVAYYIFNKGLIYQNKAGKKYHKGDYEGALADLENAVANDPKNTKIRSTYAFLLLKMGHTEKAASQIDKALAAVKLETDKNTMLVTKSLVLWKQGKVDEAIDMLTELIKTFETTNVYATLGFLHIEKGDYTKALEFNLLAKDYNSSNPVIMDNLASVYYLTGDYDSAYEIYQDVIKQKPNFPEVFYNYSKVLEQRGDLEKALYMARHALTLNFWNTSTVIKDEVETYLSHLEAKEKEMELNQKQEKEITKEVIPEEVKEAIDSVD